MRNYVSEFEDVGLIEKVGTGSSKSYELTSRGEEALSADLLDRPRLFKALNTPDKIKSLRLAPKLENQKEIAEEIETYISVVNDYIWKFEDVGLIKISNVRSAKSYELTSRGRKALSADLLNASTRTSLNPLDRYWPALSYATCNNPGKYFGGSINQDDIVKEAERLETGYNLSHMLNSAKREGYVSDKGWGDWEITEEGAELLQEGFEFEEKNLSYPEMTQEEWIEHLGQPAGEVKREVLTVNNENVILKGGKVIEIKRSEHDLKEGNHLEVEGTGKMLVDGEFEEVKRV